MLDTLQEKYTVGGVSLFLIRNRNELRVIKAMQEALGALAPGQTPDSLDVEDVYALALNNLPPRYTQRGSIVLNEPVTDADIVEAVHEAIATVRQRPKHP